LKQLLFYFR